MHYLKKYHLFVLYALLGACLNKAMEQEIIVPKGEKSERAKLSKREITDKWMQLVNNDSALKDSNIGSYYYASYVFLYSDKFNKNLRNARLSDLYLLEAGGSPRSAYSVHKDRWDYWNELHIPEKMDKEAQLGWLQDCARFVVGKYKIHLMPEDDQMTPVLKKVIDMIKRDKTFTDLTHLVKFNPDYSATYGQVGGDNQGVMARVVIYTAQGKPTAQALLDYLYKELKEFKGLGIKPRFNEKVTDLIYVAQGDGDDKKGLSFDKYFEPDKVYYSSEYFSKFSGEHSHFGVKNVDFSDMKLKNPAKVE